MVVLFYEFQFLNAMLCSLAPSDIGCSIICRLNCDFCFGGGLLYERRNNIFCLCFFPNSSGIVENMVHRHELILISSLLFTYYTYDCFAICCCLTLLIRSKFKLNMTAYTCIVGLLWLTHLLLFIIWDLLSVLFPV